LLSLRDNLIPRLFFPPQVSKTQCQKVTTPVYLGLFWLAWSFPKCLKSLIAKLPAHKVELIGHAVASRMRANEISFFIVPLDSAYKAGLTGHLPVNYWWLSWPFIPINRWVIPRVRECLSTLDRPASSISPVKPFGVGKCIIESVR